MSEITRTERKLLFAIDSLKLLKEQLIEYRTSNLCPIDPIPKLEALLADFNEVNQTLMRLHLKMSEIDPITSLPRFGPKTIERIHNLQTMYNEFSIVADELMPIAVVLRNMVVKPVIPDHINKNLEPKEEEKSPPITISAVDLMGGEDENARLNELAQKANELRELNRLKRLRKQEQIEKLKKSLTAKVDKLNSIGRGDNGLKDALSIMSEHNKTLPLSDSSSSSSLKVAVGLILSILDNIIAHPDDISLRKLRLSNPSLQTRIVRYPGAVSCLIATGFVASVLFKDITLVDTSVLPVTILTTNSETKQDSNNEIRSEEDLGEILLTMTEPDPEGSTAVWIEWFDSLSSSRNFIASYFS